MPQEEFGRELRALYRAAGQPSFRSISNEIRDRDDLPDKVSHETVSGLLSGNTIPRWSKVECVVTVLAERAHRPEPQAEVRRFLPLWNLSNDQRAAAGPLLNLEPLEPLEPPPPIAPTEPSTGTVPARNPGFTGRSEILDLMRSRLAAEPWQPLILHGLGGVGKTSIAAEFVHRESHRYDVVWWIVAEQAARTRSALAGLAERLPGDVETSQADMRLTVRNVLSALEEASFTWLLVFDNAAGPDQIQDLLPADRGAVIVTTRDGRWTRLGRTVSVDVLPRPDSIALLQRHGEISFDDADRLADRLGDLPLALEQAAAMRVATRISVADYLARLDQAGPSLLSEPRDYPHTVAGAFGLTFEEVKATSPATAQLLGMLSCMSAEPVSLALLRAADEHAIQPPLGRLLAQDSQLETAIQLLGRFGLITVTDSGQRVQTHRLVQLIVRGSMTAAEQERAYANARRLLVAANPGRPDDPLTWEMHAQIGPHIGPAGLLANRDPRSRRAVLDHIRYLYVLGDFDESLRLSAAAREAWAGPEDRWDDDETFACIDRYALALIGLGRYRDADALYEEAWVRLNNHEKFGPDSRRTARTANGVSIVSRILGNYGKALNLERYRVEHYGDSDDGEATEMLRARSSQAVCYRAIGDFGKAQAIDEELVGLYRERLGESDYRTQFAIANLARDLYGLGRYEQALKLNEDSLPIMRERLGTRHPYVLLAMRTSAVALRKTGRIAEALETSRKHYLVCQGEMGSEHAATLAAAITYANTTRVALGAGLSGELTSSQAYNTSLRAVNTYRTRFGETNPLTLTAAVNHAIILRVIGERTTARRTCESAYHLLVERVGAAHPYTQAAAIGLANDYLAQQDRDAAVRLLRQTLTNARIAQREQHPDMLICAFNLAHLTRMEEPQVGPSLTALRKALGSDHPQVAALAGGELGECDIEPPPF